MNKMKYKVLGILLIILVSSCKIYTVSTENLKSQIENFNPDNVKENEIKKQVFVGTVKYNSNLVDSILVNDNKGNKKYLLNSPTLLTRITDEKGKKHILYFDTITIDNDTLKGSRSRLIKGLMRKIALKNIVKIELEERVGRNQKRD